MALNSEHPLYTEFKDDWFMLRDFYRGERAVKHKAQHYLPATSGMHADGMGYDNRGKPKIGQAAYDAYLKRAFFQDVIKEAVEALIGMMHQKPPTFEIPDQMEPLVEKCTLQGEGLEDLLRRINTEQLTTGRVGLLADLPAGGQEIVQTGKATPVAIPYIALYIAEAAVNWDEERMQEGYNALNLVVLNESGFERQTDFTWKEVQKYRVLQLGDILKADENDTAPYLMGTFTNEAGANNLTYNVDAMKAPTLRGATLEEIPFVFINSKDIAPTTDDPPLLGLARLALAMYRGDADYRQTLFMSGQDTLVVIGGTRKTDGTSSDEEPLRVGAGARIDCEVGGDAKYIGVTANGLSEQRTSLENDRALAAQKAGRLVQPGPAKQDESGEALKTRITAQTATLNQIAIAGAKGLENLLKVIGRWMQLPEATIDGIKVTPNLEFADFALLAADLVQLMTAKSMGAPLSNESIHGIMVDRGITQMSFEDEMELVNEQIASLPTTPNANIPGTVDPNADPNSNDLQDPNADKGTGKPGAKGAPAKGAAK